MCAARICRSSAAGAAAATAHATGFVAELDLPSPRRAQQPTLLSWDSRAGCPCANASLCRPITRAGPEKAFVFHTGYKSDEHVWSLYDWSRA